MILTDPIGHAVQDVLCVIALIVIGIFIARTRITTDDTNNTHEVGYWNYEGTEQARKLQQ